MEAIYPSVRDMVHTTRNDALIQCLQQCQRYIARCVAFLLRIDYRWSVAAGMPREPKTLPQVEGHVTDHDRWLLVSTIDIFIIIFIDMLIQV